MFVKELSLKDFRNFESLNVKLGSGINVFYGDNGQGKTNILESVYFCANGRSLRAKSDRELIMFGKNEAHIQLYIERNGVGDRIDAHIMESVKGMAVNGIAVKKLGELMQNIFVVVFSPEDLSLIKDGPAERRRFADMQLCRLSSVYCHDLQQYYRVLKQRNLLLKEIQKKRDLKDTLSVWDFQLADYGRRIISARRRFTEKLCGYAKDIHSAVSGTKETLELKYRPNANEDDFIIKLEKSADRDILTGVTQVGVHKDDIFFEINGKDARLYASQGQQRTACLASVLAEISVIREEKCENPILLLDDVFSELDEKRRVFLTKHIGGLQTVLTCTGLDETLAVLKSEGIKTFRVRQGEIRTD